MIRDQVLQRLQSNDRWYTKSYSAVISRELGIPCVIGTTVATKVLQTGDFVEVDATKGVVRRLPS